LIALLDLQSKFAEALASADGRPLEGLVATRGFSTGERLSVYRNNHVSTLLRTVELTFPVLRRLLGADDFHALAVHYIGAVPSLSGNLNDYGDQFSAIMRDHPVLRGRDHLVDVAGLEWARQEVYLAADCAPMDLAHLAGLPPESYGALRFDLSPSTRLVACDWNVTALLAAPGEQDADWRPVRQDTGVLVARRDEDIELLPLDPDEFKFLKAIDTGHSLAEAFDGAGSAFDLSVVLRRHVSLGVIVAIRVDAAITTSF
jgi:hypothetical protein